MAAASSNSLNFGTGPFSMDVWVKWPNNSSPGPNPTLVNKFDGTRGYRLEFAPDLFGTTWAAGMTLLLHDTTGTYQWFTGLGGAFAKNVIPSDGGWHLVGFSYQPAAGGAMAVVKFFVDGKVVSTGMNGLAQGTVVPNVSSTASLQVGSHWTNINSLKFRGEIDELEIFNQVVAEADMKRIFDAGPSGKCRDDCATPPANMGAWYRFEEAAGSLFLDSAGSTNDMAQVGTNSIGRMAGQVGQSVRFNDDGQRLSVAAGPETGFISSGSIDLSIRTSLTPLVPIVDSSDSLSGYRFYVQNGNPVLQLTTGGSTVTWTSSLSVPVNAWTFLAVTFDRTSLSNKPVFYVNSTLDNNPNGTGLMPLPIVPSAPLWIGGMRPVPSQRIVIEASFDELEIIQRALSVAELQAIFTAGAKGKCVPPNAPAGLILDTNPVGLNLNYNSFTNQTAAIFLPNVTGNTTASAPTPQVSNGGYYVFQNWTENDPAATPVAGPCRTEQLAPPAGQTYTWTANYNLAGYLARAVGCGVTIGPLAAAISTNPLAFAQGRSSQ